MGKLIELYSPKPFSITNKTETTSEILLYGEIGENWDGTGITALKFTEELKKIPASVKNIELKVQRQEVIIAANCPIRIASILSL